MIMRFITYILCLSLMVGCSWSPTAKMITFLGTTIAVGAVVAGSNGNKNKKISTPDEINESMSGTMLALGGVLINSTTVVHVAHWPIKENQQVGFRGNNGQVSYRNIVKKTVISPNNTGADIAILTLDSPLDLSNHDILEFREPKVGDMVTIYRINRPPFNTEISSVGDDIIRAKAGNADESEIESGDSGKLWISRNNGKVYVVSLTSKGWWGEGPNLYRWRDRIDRVTAEETTK